MTAAVSRRIDLVNHDPQWAEQFALEAAHIQDAMGPLVIAIHHVGSTAIPGISAKPIIDILVEVADIALVDGHDEAMARLGYAAKGEYGISGRRYFRKLVSGIHTHHVHVYQRTHPDINRMLNFRDYLSAHPEAARAYSELKMRLAEVFRHDSIGYTDAKSEFVLAIGQQAEAWRAGPGE